MKHTVAAYDALVDKLKAEIDELHKDGDNRMHKASEIQTILTAYLVEFGSVEAALDAARAIDKKFNMGFESWVDMKYVED